MGFNKRIDMLLPEGIFPSGIFSGTPRVNPVMRGTVKMGHETFFPATPNKLINMPKKIEDPTELKDLTSGPSNIHDIPTLKVKTPIIKQSVVPKMRDMSPSHVPGKQDTAPMTRTQELIQKSLPLALLAIGIFFFR